LNDYRIHFAQRSVPPYSEQQIVLATGRVIDVEVAHSFFETEDGNLLLFSVYRDVTKRKEAERALAWSERNYHEWFEYAVQGMFQTTVGGKLVNANPALLQMLGYSSLEELQQIGNIEQLYVNPKDRERLTQLLLTHGFCRDVELTLRRKDGRIITVLEHSRVIKDVQGKPIMFEGILEDITERKAQERQLREYLDALRLSQEALAESNARKDKLLYALSHDLRSPLGSILGFAEILLEDGEKLPSDERRQFLLYIRDAARNQLKLIEELLRKPSPASAGADNRPEEIDLADVARESAVLFETVAKQKSISLSVEIPTGTPVRASKQQVLQLFNNLLSNALKFTPANGVVRLELVDQTERAWVVAVRDTGIGIPPEDQSKLFVESGTYTRPGLSGEQGSGVGLPLCAQIMKELGGKISVESSPGVGTTFYLYFPKLNAAEKVNILVVDDEPGIRALHAKYIQQAYPSAQVLQASDGRSALELMFRYRPSVVFSDYAMPNMNGLALLEAVRKHEELKRTPVVIATGHDSWAVREELESAGAFKVVSKPLPVETIKTILQSTVPNFSETR
jgi:PAS domain S-box-containing protein